MKMKRKIFILILLSFLAACESSTENNNEQALLEEPLVTTQTEETLEETYELRYHLAHADRIRSISYLAGEEIILFNANRDGYSFGGWYLDEDLTIPVESITMPNKDVDVYPKWELIEVVLPDIDEEISEVAEEDPKIEEEISVFLSGITAREDLASTDICRLRSTTENTPIKVGFPLPQERLSSTGELTVQVFFVDFDDYEGVRSNEELEIFMDDYIEGIDHFYSTQSYGQLTFNWQLHPGYVRMNEQFYDYNFKRHRMDGTPQSNDLDYIIRSAITQSDGEIDYTGVEFIVVFLNPDIPEELADVSPAWPMMRNGGFVTNEGTIYNATFIAGDGVRIGWSTIAHEMGHLLGLVDLYDYEWQKDNPTNDWYRQFVFMGIYDLMAMSPHPMWGDNSEFLGWHKYLLNWITDDQVRCLDASVTSETTHRIVANHENSDEEKLVVIQFTPNLALVSEVKDSNPSCEKCQGGVYTYLVDSSVRNGQGPIRMIRPEDSFDQFFEDAYIETGQSLVYENITISVESQDDQGTIVSVRISEPIA
jgi:M6 family metalloprotease-like protein/uncharacterized repeat protein (TIGR02543 family)